MRPLKEDLNHWTSLLESASKSGNVERIFSDDAAFDKGNKQLFDLLKLVFEQGRKEEAKRFAARARQQLIENSDNQAEELAPLLRQVIKEHNLSTLQSVANHLNKNQIETKNGNPWSPTSIKILIERINRLDPNQPLELQKTAYLEELRPIIEEIKRSGANTLQEIAQGLEDKNVPSKQGKKWHPSTVKTLLEKLGGAMSRERY